MKKTVSIIVLLLLILNFNSMTFAKDNSLKPSDITGEAAILIDGNTGETLFEKNIHKQMYPASTTKILTGILAIEMGNFDKIVTVDDKTPYEIDGTHIALEPGEKVSFKDLLYSTLLRSSNDTAVVLANTISGSVENFSELMNSKAKEIGARNSNFINPNGLHDEKHLSTAYDLAMIAKHAMNNEQFREIVKTYSYTIEPTNIKKESRYIVNGNKLLYSTNNINVNNKTVDIKYDGAIGVKTGYTTKAQQCLVSAAERNGRMLISVVLKSNGNNIWVDTHKLLNYGFDNFDSTTLGFKNEFIDNIEVEQGDSNFVTGIIGEDVKVTLPKDFENSITKNVVINDKITAPITKGQVLGQVEYKVDDEIIATANIVSTSDISLTGVYKAISKTSVFPKVNPWWLAVIGLIVLWRFAVSKKRSKRRRRYSKSSLTYKGKY